ncbi:MAG: class I SAM-dependent methyltransferase [Parcubacteria group bacterium]|nr:class I SAM-dependent methyltransferase [Parcubacteria group bacterium]
MRNIFLSPDQIFKQIDVEEGMTIADLGCGSGFMAVEAAKIVGEDGKVWAVDVQKRALSEINSNIKLHGLRNIETLHANVEKVGSLSIEENSVDVSLLVQVLHQSKLRKDIFKETKRITKSKGKVIIVEWRKEDIPMGTSMELRIDRDQLLKEAESAGLQLIENLEVGNHHYGFLMKNM